MVRYIHFSADAPKVDGEYAVRCATVGGHEGDQQEYSSQDHGRGDREVGDHSGEAHQQGSRGEQGQRQCRYRAGFGGFSGVGGQCSRDEGCHGQSCENEHTEGHSPGSELREDAADGRSGERSHTPHGRDQSRTSRPEMLR